FMSAQLVFLLQACRFRMLETAAYVVARYLLAPPTKSGRRVQIEEVKVRLTKPDALAGKALPSIEISRDRNWCALEVEETSFGLVDVIHETKDAGVYRLNVRPGGEIPLHVHHVMRETEMVLTSGLRCQREPVPAGTVYRW